MAVTPPQPTPTRPGSAAPQPGQSRPMSPSPAVSRIALEQLDVRQLSRDKIRELFRQGRLPTADQIVDEIIYRALQSGANDIHVEPLEGELQIRLGHEGILKRLLSLPSDMNDAIISVLKTKATLNQFERKKPQEGRYSFSQGGENYDFRINIIPVLAGERALVRVLHKTGRVADLNELGFRPESIELFKSILRNPRGLFLVTGPSGSGKSTTVYASVNHVQAAEKCVITAEDPVEYRLPYASQVNLPSDKSFNFVDALRAILRQNPNIILIGEIRDAETGIVASEAALTGNLVLSSMLATDAIGAIHRLYDLGVPPFWLTSSVIGIVYQQLLRRICAQCREEYQAANEELVMMGAEGASAALTLARGKGCAACNGTGYKGRIAVCEIITVSPEFKELIYQRASVREMKQEVLKRGFQDVRQDAVHKVLTGLTTVNEMVRVLG